MFPLLNVSWSRLLDCGQRELVHHHVVRTKVKPVLQLYPIALNLFKMSLLHLGTFLRLTETLKQ